MSIKHIQDCAGPLAVAAVVLSNLFYSYGESLIAAFLPELACRDSLGRVSGWGWSFGYFGGMLALELGLAYVVWAQAQGMPARHRRVAGTSAPNLARSATFQGLLLLAGLHGGLPGGHLGGHRLGGRVRRAGARLPADNHRLAILDTGLFFVLGLVLLARVNVPRGVAADAAVLKTRGRVHPPSRWPAIARRAASRN